MRWRETSHFSCICESDKLKLTQNPKNTRSPDSARGLREVRSHDTRARQTPETPSPSPVRLPVAAGPRHKKKTRMEVRGVCHPRAMSQSGEVDILWPRWVARIGVTRSTPGVFWRTDRQCTEPGGWLPGRGGALSRLRPKMVYLLFQNYLARPRLGASANAPA